MSKSMEQVKKLIEVLENTYLGDVKPYSGRGMFGKQCVSISGEGMTVWQVARAIWFDSDEEPISIPEPRQDQLGMGIVLYWPSFEWPKDEV